MRYRAFLSYSHADAGWARWLLRRLEGYRVPARLVGTPGRDGPIPARLGAMFRDRDELPSAGDLGDSIRDALGESAHLVVLCSPDAARSRWVNAEVEAFRAAGRGDRVLCFVVGGDPAARDPATACFPPALLAPGADGQAREPLAADARPETDGRERAFLKLVAGLLGIGYDSLARREAQRRGRRLALVAAAAIAGMAVTSTLAVTAHVARNDAQRRQAQAEDLLGFMLGDLRAKLTTVGRLDLMRAVDDKATGYFASLEPRDLSDRALAEQARSLTGIGQVRMEEGKHEAALAAFREAHARSRALQARAPRDGQRLFDLAQAQYWIGYVALAQGRLDEAARWLTAYRDSARRLAAMDPGNFDWQKEVAYGQHNLAVLDERRGRLREAEVAMREVLELYRKWVQAKPRDTALRQEAANVASWLGTLAMRQGRLADAEALFAEQVRGLDRNRAQEPDDARWREHASAALSLLADAQMRQGRFDAAQRSNKAAAVLAEQLVRQDPGNRNWAADLAFVRFWQAELDAATGVPGADALARETVARLARVHAAQPKDLRVRRGLARAHQLVAYLHLRAGDPAGAALPLRQARALLGAAAGDGAVAAMPVEHARLLLLEGQAAADPAQARRAWQQARTLLEGGPRPLPFEHLDPLVRALHHLGADAQAGPHLARLQAAGYVPARPWPAEAVVAAR